VLSCHCAYPFLLILIGPLVSIGRYSTLWKKSNIGIDIVKLSTDMDETVKSQNNLDNFIHQKKKTNKNSLIDESIWGWLIFSQPAKWSNLWGFEQGAKVISTQLSTVSV
jgi:hypothetical protein